jgi:hypothetical protein
MNMLNVNFFAHKRTYIFPLIFHFMKKIKPENKEKLTLNILVDKGQCDFFNEFTDDNLKINIIEFNSGFNYTDKLTHVINLDAPYSFKMDEDCIINNHIWDYMIENADILDDEENLLISPLLSTSYPSCDYFIEGFLNEDQQNYIHHCFLKQAMPNGLFGVDYSPLNQFTIQAKEWDFKAYSEGLSKISHELKGMHPMRISYDAQIGINNMISQNVDGITQKNDYNIFEIDAPYFTINMFLMKTSVWKHIVESYGGIFDEVPITKYKEKNNKKFLFIENGFGIHTMYNTIYGDKNKWGIGGVDSEEQEKNFITNLKLNILL